MTAVLVLLALLVGLAVGVLAGRSLARRDEEVMARSFTGLATQALRESDGQSRQAVAALVGPLQEQLVKVEGQLRELEVERARAFGELREQVGTVRRSSQELGEQTASLVDALRRPQARGRWGEVQLRRVVEHAGMLDRCDFSEQLTMTSAEGAALRPDMVVKLAGGRCIAVDAKVTLAAYLEAFEARDGDVREQRLAAHAKHLRQHVDRLAEKSYWSRLPDSPEFVVLFLPGEAFLAPALEQDPGLLEHAWSKRVHLATPTTLVSLLRTCAHAWQQQALTDNARAVVAAGRDLHGRLATLGGHVDKLGRSLARAVEDFNGTVGSLERTVLPAARRMSELGLDAAELPDPTRVDVPVRRTTAAELVPLAAVPDEATG